MNIPLQLETFLDTYSISWGSVRTVVNIVKLLLLKKDFSAKIKLFNAYSLLISVTHGLICNSAAGPAEVCCMWRHTHSLDSRPTKWGYGCLRKRKLFRALAYQTVLNQTGPPDGNTALGFIIIVLQKLLGSLRINETVLTL